MNYLQWNNAIIRHFFNPKNEEKEVMLYFSEAIIEEIGINNFLNPDEGYVEDFYKALRLGVAGIPKDNYINRILQLEQKYRQGCKSIDGVEFEYPPHLTYIIAFILPFTSGNANEDFNMNNFHGYVKEFFEKKQLTQNYDGIIKNHLIRIDDLWIKISEWLMVVNNFNLGILEEINPPLQRRFVGKFEYHILFKKEHEERLAMLFDEKDILPGGVISENEIRKLLVNNFQRLRLSLNTKNIINDPNDYIGGKILKRALSFYKNWDGITHTVEGQRGYSRNRLVLCLDFNFISHIINLKYFRIYSKNGISANLHLEYRDGKIIKEKIHQINSFYSNPIENCFKDLTTDIQLSDNAARGKYTWKKRDFYIFKKISQFDWVEIPLVEYNVGRTLIICKHTFYDNDLRRWFENISTNKKLYNNNINTQLPNGWLALTIEHIANFPHPTIQELIPELGQTPKINFDKSFYIDGKIFKDKLPKIWLENIEILDDIIAKYEDGSEIKLNHLTQNEEGITKLINQFTFTDEHKSRLKLNQQFKLICKDISTHRFLHISDFKRKNNEEIEFLLPKKDVIGQLTMSDENYFKGIEHYFSDQRIRECIPYQNQLNGIFIKQQNNNQYRQNSEYNAQHLGNLLIHFISAKGQLDKNEFNNAVFSLLENIENSQENIKKIAVRLSYLLQGLAYVDYDSSKSSFYINKPHLVSIPVATGAKFNLIGARDPNMIAEIINYCKKNTFLTIEIQTNEDNILLPQTINLHLNKCDHNLIKHLVNFIRVIFKKDNLFTQFALTACFPDISNWRIYIHETPENEIKDTEGGYSYDIETLKFIAKLIDFGKDLSFIKFTNINGYKTVYRLWYENICYSIPDQQLGIYLYLYLYKEIRDIEYNKCKIEKGSANCIAELEAKDKAQLKTNIIVFDTENKLLAVPFYCGLPKYFSASFQLLSGHPPYVQYLEFEGVRYKGMYQIYQNIPGHFVGNILNNRLLKRDLLNPIFKKTIIL